MSNFSRGFAGALAVLAILLSSSVRSEEFRDYYHEPGTNIFKETVNDSLNESISPFSGTIQLGFTDVFIPGNGGMDIRLMRFYTSLQPSQYPVFGAVGAGWTMHFGRVIAPAAHFAKICSQNSFNAFTDDNPSIEFSDGSRQVLVLDNFIQHNFGTDEAPDFRTRNDNSLITANNWRMHCVTTDTILHPVLTSPNGTTFHMNVQESVAGELSWLPSRIEDLNGNWIRIDYKENNISGNGKQYIDKIYRSEEGNATPVLTFHYNDAEATLGKPLLLEEIHAENGTRKWIYKYEQELVGFLFENKQLTSVTLPTGEEWKFDYYPKIPDSNPNDDRAYDDVGSYSIKQITYPNGAVIDYEYQGIEFSGPTGDLTTAIDKKTLSNTKVDGTVEQFVWHYDFEPKSTDKDPVTNVVIETKFSEDPTLPGVPIKFDKTTVTNPDLTTVVYLHKGQGEHFDETGVCSTSSSFLNSHIGALRGKYTYDAGGTIIRERRLFSWNERQISHETSKRTTVNGCISEEPYSVLTAKGEYFGRDSSAPTNILQFAIYGDYDVYGNPGYVYEPINLDITEAEKTDGELAKKTFFNYKTDANQWIVGLPDEERITVTSLLTSDISAIDAIIGTEKAKITRDYFANGLLKSENRFGVVTAHTYHATGDLHTTTDAENNVVQYSNYVRGTPQLEEYEENTQLSREVNTTGTIKSITDQRSNKTIYNYDLLNRLENIDYPLNLDVNIDYVKTGDIYQRELTRGQFKEVTKYDGFFRPLEMVRTDLDTSETITTTYRYDAFGRVTFESYPNSSLGFETVYDALGRIKSVTAANEFTVFYDYDSTGYTVTNERNYKTKYNLLVHGINIENAHVYRIDEEIDDTKKQYTTIRPNALGQPSEIRQDNGGAPVKRTYKYNNKFWLEEQYDPEIGTTIFTHDLVGNVKTERLEQQPVITYIYDKLYRLKTVDYSDSTPDIGYTYYDNGLTETISKGDSHWTFEFDANDNLDYEELSINRAIQRTYRLDYAYNALDNLASLTFPDGFFVDYQPDNFGRPTKVGSIASNVEFHPSGQLKSYLNANGTESSIELNSRLFPESIGVKKDLVDLVNLAYDYDPAGNIKLITDNVNPTRSVQLNLAGSYDGLNRLGNVYSAGWRSFVENWPEQRMFDYDATGNIKSLTAAVVDLTTFVTETYKYDVRQRLLQLRGDNFYYDRRGNMTKKYSSFDKVSQQYLFDSANQLIYYSETEGLDRIDATAAASDKEKSFAYDGRGWRFLEQRWEKLEGASTLSRADLVYQVYDSSGQLIFEEDFLDCRKTSFVKLGSRTIASSSDAPDDASTDSDADQIPDCFEQAFVPIAGIIGELDSDGDGLTNYQEVMIYGTDPQNSDTDGDLIDDDEEINVLNTKPLMSDTDRDGLSDHEELNGIFITDPLNADTDFDGVADGIEISEASDPLSPADGFSDPDGDGFSTLQEVLLSHNPNDANDHPQTDDANGAVLERVRAIWEKELPAIPLNVGGSTREHWTGVKRWLEVGIDGTVYLALPTLEETESYDRVASQLVAYETDGPEKWSQQLSENIIAVKYSPVQDVLYLLTENSDKTHETLEMFDAAGQRSFVEIPPGYSFYSDNETRISLDSAGNVYFKAKSSTGATPYLFTYDAVNQQLSVFETSFEPAFANVVGPLGHYYLVDGTTSRLIAMDSSGVIIWSRAFDGEARNKPVIDFDGYLYLNTSAGLYRYDLGGNQYWHLEEITDINTVYALNDGELLAVGNTSYLIDVNAGAISRTIPYGSSRSTLTDNNRLVLFNDHPIVPTQTTIVSAIDLENLPPVFDSAFDPEVIEFYKGTTLIDHFKHQPVIGPAGILYLAKAESVFALSFDQGPGRFDNGQAFCSRDGTVYSVTLDSDTDGINDCAESVYGFSALENNSQFDSDSDGLSDLQELVETLTNPKDADTDKDTIADGDEISLLLDPRSSDTDGDSVADNIEIALGRDPKQKDAITVDTDGDGFSDHQEISLGTAADNILDRPMEDLGDVLWISPQPGEGNFNNYAPAVTAGNNIVFVPSDSNLVSFNPNGDLQWSYRTEFSEILGGPVSVQDGTVHQGGYIPYYLDVNYSLIEALTIKFDEQGNRLDSVSQEYAVFNEAEFIPGSDEYVPFNEAFWKTQFSSTLEGDLAGVEITRGGIINQINEEIGLGGLGWERFDGEEGSVAYDGILYWTKLSPRIYITDDFVYTIGNELDEGNIQTGATTIEARNLEAGVVWTLRDEVGVFDDLTGFDQGKALIRYESPNQNYRMFVDNGGSELWRMDNLDVVRSPDNKLFSTRNGLLCELDIDNQGAEKWCSAYVTATEFETYISFKENGAIVLANGATLQIFDRAGRPVVTRDLTDQFNSGQTFSSPLTSAQDGVLFGMIHYPEFADRLVAISSIKGLGDISDDAFVSISQDFTPSVVAVSSKVDLIAQAYNLGSAIDGSSLAWSSDRQGPLGSGESITSELTIPGVHNITASMMIGGVQHSDSIQIEVSDQITLPTVNIVEPLIPAEFTFGEAVRFDATISSGTPSITWESDIQGFIGQGSTIIERRLIPGTHVVTASHQQGDSRSTAQITVVVEPAPGGNDPEVTITSHMNGDNVLAGASTTFTATANDVPDGSISHLIQWWLGPSFLGSGPSVSPVLNGFGQRTIIARIEDSDGNTAEAPVTVNLVSSLDQDPEITILQPVDGSSFNLGESVNFVVLADDPEDNDISNNVSWFTTSLGQFDTGANVSVATLPEGQHTITAEITDSGNNTVSDSVTITITNNSTQPEQMSFTSIASEDGWIKESSENSNTAGTVKNDANNEYSIRAGDTGTDQQYKGFLSFNISALPSDAVIQSVELVTQQSGTPTQGNVNPLGPLYLDFSANGFNGSNQLQGGDFNAPADVEKVAEFNIGTGTASLNAAGISAVQSAHADGNRVQLRMAFDIDDDNDNTKDYTGFYSSNVGNSALHPQLVVTYTQGGGGNNAPTIDLVSHPQPLEVHVGVTIDFSASASDIEDGVYNNEISWHSSINDFLGNGANLSVSTLSPGAHTITVSVTDSGGLPASDEVVITVLDAPPIDLPPTIFITQPATGNSFLAGELITFSASVNDPEEGDIGHQVRWLSDRIGHFDTGSTVTASNLPAGQHVITAEITDIGNNKEIDVVVIDIDGSTSTPEEMSFTSVASEDGWIKESSENSNTAGTIKSDANNEYSIRAGDTGTDQQYKGFLSFNISALPSDAVIQSVELVTQQSGNPTQGNVNPLGPLYLDFSANGFNGSNQLQAGDFNAPADVEKVAEFNIGTGRASLNAAGISAVQSAHADGNRVQLRMAFDIDDDNDNVKDYTGFYSSNAGNSNLHPQLVVTYTLGNSGPNTPPEIQITAPGNNSSFGSGETVNFSASVTDAEEANLASAITWVSSANGSLGSGGSISRSDLLPGEHTITASVTDSGGLSGSATLTITVADNQAPTVSIVQPANNSTVIFGSEVSFSATANDPEQGDISHLITWFSSQDLAIGFVPNFSTSSLSLGQHTISASVLDAEGQPGGASITINVVADVNQAPNVTILTPGSGSSFDLGSSIPFSATANDPEDDDISNGISWSSSRDGNFADNSAAINYSDLTAGTHTITASVTDSGETQGFATITITINDSAAPPEQMSFTSIASEDGWIKESSENSNSAGTVKPDANNEYSIRAGDTGTDQQYKGFLSFNINALPADAVIQSAELVTQQSGNPTQGNVNPLGPLYLDFSANGFNGSNQLQGGDFNAPADVEKVAEFNIATGTANLNAAGISAVQNARANSNRVQLRMAFDIDDDNDNTKDYTGFYSSNAGNSSLHPQLIIHYTVGGGPVNTPPSVNIVSPNNDESFELGEAVLLSANATDNEDSNILNSLVWEMSDGTLLGNSNNLSLSSLALGNYTIIATVTDSGDLTASDSVDISVIDSQVNPGPTTYTWTIVDESNAEVILGGATPNHTFASSGIYTINLDVSNDVTTQLRSLNLTVIDEPNCNVDYVHNQVNNSDYIGKVTITNLSNTIMNPWSLVWDLASGESFTPQEDAAQLPGVPNNFWKADLTVNGNTVTAIAPSLRPDINQQIDANGGSIIFNHKVVKPNGTSPKTPDAFSLNGGPCTINGVPLSGPINVTENDITYSLDGFNIDLSTSVTLQN